MDLGEAFVPIRATLDKLDKDLADARARVGTAFDGVLGKLKALGTVAIAGIAVGLLAVGAAAFTMAADVDGATKKVQAQLGLSAEAAEGYSDAIADIYGQNFGDSIADVGEKLGVVSLAFARLGDVGVETTQAATINAIRLADAYGVDVAKSASTAATLMDEFGLSQQQAFDLMTTGFQNGMDSSGDFLDSLGEYSSVMSSMGFDAAEMFSIMETGQLGGVQGTDKIIDSMKEWGIIMTTEPARAGAALKTLGMDFDEIAAEVSSGEATLADYFGEMVAGLNDIEDPLLRQQTAVALFGTMAEDMGDGFLAGLDMMATGLSDMEGATESLDAQYDTLGSALEGFKRQGEVALLPLGELLLGLANMILPEVMGAMTRLSEAAQPVVDGFLSFVESVSEGTHPLNELATAVGEFVQPLTDLVTGFFSWQDVAMAAGLVLAAILIPAIWAGVAALAAMVVAALPFIAAFAAIVAVIALVRTAWEQNWGGIQEKTAEAMAYVQGVVMEGVAAVRAWWAENGDAVMAKAQEIWDTVSTHVGRGIENAKALVSEGVAAIKAWWAENGDEIMAKAQEIWDMVSTHVGRGMAKAKELISEGLATIKAWWAENGATVTATVLAIWEGIKNAYKTALAFVLGLVATVLAAIGGDWETAGEAWNTVVSEAWDRLKTAFTDGLDILKNAVGDAWPQIKQAFSDGITIIKDLFNSVDWGAVGKAVIDGIAAGLKAAGGAIADAATEAAQAALDAAKDLLGINSPSSVFQYEVAEDGIGEGTVVGLENSARPIAEAMNDLFAPLPSLANSAWDSQWADLDGRAMRGDYAMTRKIGQGMAGALAEGGSDGRMGGASLVINVDARGNNDPEATERASRRGVESAMATNEWFRAQVRLAEAMG